MSKSAPYPLHSDGTNKIYSGKMVPVNAFKLGWTPKWDEQKMLLSLDDEIDAVIESEEIKPTIFSSLD